MKKMQNTFMAAVIGALSFSNPSQSQNVTGIPTPDLRKVTVDVSSNLGTMKPLRGVNAGPLPWSDKPAVEKLDSIVEVSDRTGYRSLGADASAGYRDANIELVRIHDNYGPGDIHLELGKSREMAHGTQVPAEHYNKQAMFPDLSADPSNPESYNFGPTDTLVEAIYNIGAEPLFRLGYSAGDRSGIPDSFNKDSEFEHYAEVAGNVVRHYNKGWHKGFNYGIKYWEVLNEPDGRFEAKNYYKLYAAIAKEVKAADSEALIGGPALMFTHNGPNYRESFLEYLKTNNLLLDFWTFHDYNVDAADPYLYVRLAEDMRKLLDDYGFDKAEVILDEWNVLGIDPELLTLGGRAAFTASAIIYMQDSPIDKQTFYMGPNLFGEDGNTPNKVGQALIALGEMKKTPIRLATKGDDKDGFAVQAGKSADGNSINILISNYEVPQSLRGPRPYGDTVEGAGYKINLLPRRTFDYQNNDGFDLRVSGLNEEKRYKVQRYRINDAWDFRLLSTEIVTGSELQIKQTLGPPSIELVSLTVVNK